MYTIFAIFKNSYTVKKFVKSTLFHKMEVGFKGLKFKLNLHVDIKYR